MILNEIYFDDEYDTHLSHKQIGIELVRKSTMFIYIAIASTLIIISLTSLCQHLFCPKINKFISETHDINGRDVNHPACGGGGASLTCPPSVSNSNHSNHNPAQSVSSIGAVHITRIISIPNDASTHTTQRTSTTNASIEKSLSNLSHTRNISHPKHTSLPHACTNLIHHNSKGILYKIECKEYKSKNIQSIVRILSVTAYDLWDTLPQINVKTFLCNQFGNDTVSGFTGHDLVQHIKQYKLITDTNNIIMLCKSLVNYNYIRLVATISDKNRLNGFAWSVNRETKSTNDKAYTPLPYSIAKSSFQKLTFSDFISYSASIIFVLICCFFYNITMDKNRLDSTTLICCSDTVNTSVNNSGFAISLLCAWSALFYGQKKESFIGPLILMLWTSILMLCLAMRYCGMYILFREYTLKVLTNTQI